MKRVFANFVISAIFNSGIIFGQNYPFLSMVDANVRVNFDSVTQIYTYIYRLRSDQSNSGSISEFKVDVTRDLNTVEFDTVGLQFDSDFEESDFRLSYPRLASRIVPVSVSDVPSSYWIGLIGLDATFFCDTLFIAPGDSVGNLVLTSKGLPGIRRFVVKPDFDPLVWFPDEEDTTSTLTAEQMDSIRAAINFYGYTVEPYSTPTPFTALTFLDTITSYITESRTLGWITNDATADKYRRLIDTARSHLEANNRGVTKARLDSVLVNVYPDSAAGLITSEAYALLRFNTEYVLKKLREEEEK